MYRIVAILSGTQVDSHGDSVSIEALAQMAKSTERHYITLGKEHDARHPPHGRIVRSWVEKSQDGHSHLVGEIEVFEAGDSAENIKGDGRTVNPESLASSNGPGVYFGTRNPSPEESQLLRRIATLLDAENRIHHYARKSIDIQDILLVSLGLFTLRSISEGILNRLGADIYEQLKTAIRGWRECRSGSTRVEYVFLIQTPRRQCEIQVLVDDTEAGQADLRMIATYLDEHLPRLRIDDLRLCRVVYQVIDHKIEIEYRVREDGVPLELNSLTQIDPNTGFSAGAIVTEYSDRAPSTDRSVS